MTRTLTALAVAALISGAAVITACAPPPGGCHPIPFNHTPSVHWDYSREGGFGTWTNLAGTATGFAMEEDSLIYADLSSALGCPRYGG